VCDLFFAMAWKLGAKAGVLVQEGVWLSLFCSMGIYKPPLDPSCSSRLDCTLDLTGTQPVGSIASRFFTDGSQNFRFHLPDKLMQTALHS